jgi:hypothetical protein
MIAPALIDPSRLEIKLGRFSTAPASALSDGTLLGRAQEYRRQSSAQLYPLARADIAKRLPAAKFHVSRKIDGQFDMLVYRQGQVLSVNPGGTVRVGLPCHEEAKQRLAAAGVQEALLAVEIYLETGDRRSRVHDITSVVRQPQTPEHLQRIRCAVFDVISVNGQPVTGPFEPTWELIQTWFGGGTLVHPVEAEMVADARGVEGLFQKWVETEGAEGIVVRNDSVGMFKVKPLHTLDAVVVGFTEGTDERQGLLHDILVALMRNDGSFHVLCRVGGGFAEEDRRQLLSDMKDMVVESDYAEVNSDHVAYMMVRPEWVIELSCLDLVAQTTRGGPINRMVLNWDRSGARYEAVRRLPLCSVISPQFLRRREDKSARPQDTRLAQVAKTVEVPLAEADVRELTLAKSQVLKREVYTKSLKGATMVRKFVLWKTNKEAESEDYPAFVVHMTDFSPNRKAPLQRDVRVSNSAEQIEELWRQLKEDNIKKGWQAHNA